LRGERYNRRVTIIALFVHTLPVVPVGREIAGSMPHSPPGRQTTFLRNKKARNFASGLEVNQMRYYGSLCVAMEQLGPFVTLAPGE
jgi:hypothetical protein